MAGAATTNTEAGAAGGEPGRKKRWQHCHRRHQQCTVINNNAVIIPCHLSSFVMICPQAKHSAGAAIWNRNVEGEDWQRQTKGAGRIWEKYRNKSFPSNPTIVFENLICNWTQPNIMATDKLCEKHLNQPFRTQVFMRALKLTSPNLTNGFWEQHQTKPFPTYSSSSIPLATGRG